MQPSFLIEVRQLAEASVDDVYAEVSHFRWEDRNAYGNWLAQTYYYVRHATRLLAFAAARCRFDEEDLHRDLLHDIGEEKGHEALALNDLQYLGLAVADFPEMPATAAYHQTLYFAIDHDGPAALLGYFLPLEGVAALKLASDYRRITKAFSPGAASFLRVHREQDVGHFAQGLKALDRFTDRQLESVRRAIELSVPLYRSIIKGIISSGQDHLPRINQ